MDQDLLSIITINKNNSEGLKKTINSVLNQTYENIEYIVVDGDSSDNSKSVINQYTQQLSYYISEPDTGIYNAMNKGIKKASGKYCLFLNSGDYLINNDIITGVFNNNINEDIVYGNQMKVAAHNYLVKFPQKLSLYYFYKEYLGHNSTLIKRRLFDSIGLYNENYRIVADHEFFLKAIFIKVCSTKYLNTTISAMQKGGISNTQKYNSLVLRERDEVFNILFPKKVKLFKIMFSAEETFIIKTLKKAIKKVRR